MDPLPLLAMADPLNKQEDMREEVAEQAISYTNPHIGSGYYVALF